MADGRIIIDTQVDSSGAEKGVSKLGSIVGKGIKGITGIVTGVSAAVAGVGVACTNLASDLAEVQNVVDTTFGANNNKIEEWCQNASKQFGLNELQAKQFTSTLGAMMKSSGITGSALEDMSTSLVGLSADFASFYNLSNEEAFEKIRAGISGETEPLKQLGINMSVANMEAYALSQGINKSWNEMSQAEQTQLRYNFLMSAGADANGDFAKTLENSLPNQLRVAKNSIQDLGASIGKDLIPVALEGTKVLNESISNMKQAFADGGLEGLASSVGTELSNILTWVVDKIPSFIDVGVKVVEGLIQGMISNLPSIATSLAKGISSLAQGIITLFPQFVDLGIKLILELAKGIGEQLPTLIPVLVEGIINLANVIIENLPLFIDAVIQLTLGIANGLIEALPIIINKLPELIQNLCDAIINNLPTILDAVIQIIIAVAGALIENFPLVLSALGECALTILAKLLELGGEILSWLFELGGNVLSKIGEIIGDVVDWFAKLPGRIWNWLKETVVKVAQWVVEMRQKAIEGMKNVANGIVNCVKELPGKIYDCGVNIVKGLWNGIKSVKDWIWSKIKGFFGGIVDDIKDFFGIHSPSRVRHCPTI